MFYHGVTPQPFSLLFWDQDVLLSDPSWPFTASVFQLTVIRVAGTMVAAPCPV